jgi:CubicO group peptidase (beta-lactamase class C family)
MESDKLRHSQSTARLGLLLRTAVCLAVLGGCTLLDRTEPLAAPEDISDGWAVAAPAEEGLDDRRLARLTEELAGDTYGMVHSCLVARNGKLVYEQYFHGQRRDMLHNLYSVTKSVTSALMGIAIDAGLVGDIHTPAIEYFPEYVGEGWDERKESITLEHLLTMSSGLEFDEWSYSYSDARNSYTQMTGSSDWMRWTWESPLVAEPGRRFAYSSGNSHLFSGILFKTTGQHADAYAEEHLFRPLGIERYEWVVGNGYATTSGAMGGLQLRPRDMAKFGQLYLQNGRWDGEQVVPAWWVEDSLQHHVDLAGKTWLGANTWYGYQWWLHRSAVRGRELDWFAGRGYADQIIAVIPDLDMVVVITAGNGSAGGRVDGAIQAILAATSSS